MAVIKEEAEGGECTSAFVLETFLTPCGKKLHSFASHVITWIKYVLNFIWFPHWITFCKGFYGVFNTILTGLPSKYLTINHFKLYIRTVSVLTHLFALAHNIPLTSIDGDVSMCYGLFVWFTPERSFRLLKTICVSEVKIQFLRRHSKNNLARCRPRLCGTATQTRLVISCLWRRRLHNMVYDK